MAPRVGFSPTRPQQAAGTRIEPPASVAWAIATIPAATAAAAPPEEPPGRSGGIERVAADRTRVPVRLPMKDRIPGSWSGRTDRSPHRESALQYPSQRNPLRRPSEEREPALTGKPAKGPPRSFASVGTPAKGRGGKTYVLSDALPFHRHRGCHAAIANRDGRLLLNRSGPWQRPGPPP